MARRDFQRLARARIKDADELLRARRYAAAYYLAGYAVECALKACIAKQTRRYEFPDRRRVNESWQHDLNKLVGAASLSDELEDILALNERFKVNWETVAGWSEQSRYEQRSRSDATDLYRAIIDEDDGVLAWLIRYW